MIGAIIGDIAGSRFEWHNIKTKDFELLMRDCHFTDDTVMSLAVCEALMSCKSNHSDLSEQAIACMQEIGNNYPHAGYGGSFRRWLSAKNPQPYNSWGNGSAMRVSGCGYAAERIEDAIQFSRMVTEITHNHPEGIKGAEATAVAVYLARSGKNILEIRDYINQHYYPINFTLDSIRDDYTFDVSCQGSVPQALEAFFESRSFEDAIRNAISIGGDSDTIAAITGSIAEAYYGVPTSIRKHALTFLDERLLNILVEFENLYPAKVEVVQDGTSVAFEPAPARKVEAGERADTMKAAMAAADEDQAVTTSTPEETTSQKLFSHLFEACNILRGPINQDEYKSYVTPILFFKRLSDVYDEETQKALEESGGDMEYAAFPENHRFDIPEHCHWNDVRQATENVGLAIVNAMTGIERANPDTLSGVFTSFDDAVWTDKNKLSDARLKDLIEHMSKIKVGNNNYSADIMGDSYEYLIKKFADLSKKSAGEFYTPRAVVSLLIKILSPQAGETVYDPACGTGGMLIESIRYMNDDRSTYGKIYGQEKNLATSAIARMNLFLHGARDFRITQGDTLRMPNYLYHGTLQKFDCVIANPPFSLENWGADPFSSDIYGRNLWGCPTDANGDFAWIQHMVASMKPLTGRCAVVLPQGVLSRGNREYEIRKNMILSDKLECVISVVNNLFYGAIVPACILIFRDKKPNDHRGKVCMIDASRIYTAQRAQNILTKDNVEEIYQLYQNFGDVEEKSTVVTLADLAQQNYTLAVNRYVKKALLPLKPLNEAYQAYLECFEAVSAEEKVLDLLLQKGGYFDEQ